MCMRERERERERVAGRKNLLCYWECVYVFESDHAFELEFQTPHCIDFGIVEFYYEIQFVELGSQT